MFRCDLARRISLTLCLVLATTSCGRRLSDSVTPRANGSTPTSTSEYEAQAQSLVVVSLQPQADPYSVVASCGGEVVEYQATEDLVSLRVEPSVGAEEYMLRLSQDARVLAVEQEHNFETSEARQRSFAFDDGLGSAETFAEQPAGQVIGLPSAHNASQGDGVLIAVLDTGADLTHPELQGMIAGGKDFVDHDDDPSEHVNGFDDDGDGDVDEAHGHGTHVAGIVRLTAPRARLLIVRVLDAEGRGSLLRVASGVRWAIKQGARVINLSLGSLRSSPAVGNALAEAESRGIVTVVSAGNWGGASPVEFPASSSHALAVAAVDADGVPADWTSRGDHVALSAPGVGVRSTYPGGAYRLWSGTSMSAPFVSGTVALLMTLHPAWTPAELRQHLAGTVHPIPGAPMNGMGAGWLDAGSALAPLPVPEDPTTEEIRPK